MGYTEGRGERSEAQISFESAAKVFGDPNIVLVKDRIDQTGEQRWNAMGNVEGIVLLLVYPRVSRKRK